MSIYGKKWEGGMGDSLGYRNTGVTVRMKGK